MKVTENKGYGLIGLKVNFNLMDCYEASHMLDRVDAILSGREAMNDGCTTLTQDGIEETMCLLEMMKALLEKIAIQPSEMPSIFAPKEEEKIEEMC